MVKSQQIQNNFVLMMYENSKTAGNCSTFALRRVSKTMEDNYSI